MNSLQNAMNLPSSSILGALSLLLVVGACELINGSHSQAVNVSGIELENRTEDDLYVLAFTQDALSRIRIASELAVESNEPGWIAPGATLDLPLEVVAADIRTNDTLVFIFYVPVNAESGGAAQAHPFRQARMLALDLEELAQLSYRFAVSPADLRSDHLFGDPYEIISGEDDATDEAYPPRIDGDELRLWVGFGGCRSGAFNLSHQVSGRGLLLTLVHDYPDSGVDCRRYSYRELTIHVPDDVAAAERVLLLNPNSSADPYRDAFIVEES